MQRLTVLRRYLEASWEGLRDWRVTESAAPADGLGAAEEQGNHLPAARMIRRGRRVPGAQRMALLRCLEAEGRLAAWLQQWVERRWQQAPAGAGEGGAPGRRAWSAWFRRPQPGAGSAGALLPELAAR